MKYLLRGVAAALALASPQLLAVSSTHAQTDSLAGGTPVVAPDAVLTTPLSNVAAIKTVPVTDQPFTRARQVTITQPSQETNAVQITIPNAAPVTKGDALLATFFVRGTRPTQATEAPRVAFLFERATSPWTKSVTRSVALPPGNQWRKVVLGFTSSEDYQPAQAMASLRLAFGPQTVEIGGLSLVNLGKTRTARDLVNLTASLNPLGNATATVNRQAVQQTIDGFGGNFCQPRYGRTEALDTIGRYNLDHLNVRCARVGIPLNYWNPAPGDFKDDAQAHACLLAMQELTRRKIPIIGTVWEAPAYLVPGKPEQAAKEMPRANYDAAANSIIRFLTLARDKYHAEAEYFSFNEADYGINTHFSPAQIAAFIRVAGPKFRAAGLKTRFLVGDTANGNALVGYATPLLKDKTLAPYLGPIAFHCWDVLDAPDSQYTAIAALGKKYGKTIWCTEAGFDSALWERPDPWASWDSGLRLAIAYARTLNLSHPSRMYYWTYQDNYPIVSQDARQQYPTFNITHQFETLFPKGSRVVRLTNDREDLNGIAALSPQGKLSLLLMNQGGTGQITLRGVGTRKRLSVFVTSEKGQTAPRLMTSDASGTLTIAAPARSVITISEFYLAHSADRRHNNTERLAILSQRSSKIQR